jgi:hypothetical protein
LEDLDADPDRAHFLTGWRWIQDNLDRLPTSIYDITA